jgi:hypothetical protein
MWVLLSQIARNRVFKLNFLEAEDKSVFDHCAMAAYGGEEVKLHAYNLGFRWG